MIGEEKLRLMLSLAYKISTLYLKTMCSVSVIADLTEVPISTIKRYLNMIGNKVDDYLRLLPELGNKEQLLELQKKIDEQKEQNIIENKWSTAEAPFDIYKDQVAEIKVLYNQIKPLSDEEIRTNIKNLQLNSLSMREIAQVTKVSLGRIHRIINQEKGQSR